jgi:hypothetical protein
VLAAERLGLKGGSGALAGVIATEHAQDSGEA